MLKTCIIASDSDLAKDLIPQIDQDMFELYLFDKTHIDVTNPWSLKVIEDLKPDIVINFAGILTPGYIHEQTPDAWKKQIEVNLIGAYNVIQAAIAANQYTKLIMIGSKAAHSPREARSAYCASKAGLQEMTKCLILEGLDIYLLNLGPVATKMRRGLNLCEDPNTILKPSDVSRRILKIMENREWRRVIFYDKIESNQL